MLERALDALLIGIVLLTATSIGYALVTFWP
jgi:hypothetical protein